MLQKIAANTSPRKALSMPETKKVDFPHLMAFQRRKVDKAIDAVINPVGMHVGNMAHIPVDILQRMLAVIDSQQERIKELQSGPDTAEQVQWRNIRKVVDAIAIWAFGSADNTQPVSQGSAFLCLKHALTAKDGIQVELEPLPKEKS